MRSLTDLALWLLLLACCVTAIPRAPAAEPILESTEIRTLPVVDLPVFTASFRSEESAGDAETPLSLEPSPQTEFDPEFERILLLEELKSSWFDLPLPFTEADLIEDGAIGDTSGLVNPFDRERMGIEQLPLRFWHHVSDEWRDWTSRFIIGARYLSGNSNQSAIDVAADFEKKLDTRATQFNLGGQFGESNNTIVANRWFANSTTDFYRGEHLIIFLRALDQYDQLQNLDYRGTFSLGPGYRFFDDDRRRLVVRAGPAVTTELFHRPFLHRTSPDIFGEVEVRWPLWERLKWEQKSTVFPSVENFEVARAQSQTSLFYALDERERWSLRLGFLYQYNSQLTAGRVPSDYTTNLSVVYQRK